MLYDAYTKKVQRLVLFLRKVFKNIVPISIVTGVIVVATIACLLSVGTITTGVECPSELVYGQTVDHSAKAFMADVQYEYSLAGSDEWTTTLPIEPGNYLVRAVSTNIFGSKTYSEEKSFVLNKKQIEVKVAESTMVYGGELSVTAGLVAGDSIQCKDFVFADATAANTQVNAVAGSVVIINKDGKDVTSSYDILTPASSISIAPRPLQLTIHGNEDVYYYNGIALRYGGYEVNEGTPLVDGDEIRVSYESRYQQTNAGEFTVNDENEPELSFKVLNKDGFDVSGHYDMSAVWGTLKVDQKVIGVTAQGKVFVYDGTEKTFDQLNSGYVVDDEIISLLESLGHTLRVKNPGSLSVLNAGDKKPNLLDFEIVDADNNDVTSNYSFLYIDSENVYIEMTVRPVQITLEDSEKIYDGIEIDRSFEIFETDNNGEKKKVTGTTLKAGDNASSLKFDLATVPGYKIVVDVNGTRTNVQSLTSADNDTYSVNWYVEDASGNKVDKSNFNITGSDLEATLKINPRPITITLTDFTKEYDGIALNRAYKVTEKDNSGKVINVAEVTLDADDVASELSHALATVEGQNIVIDVVGARTNVELLTASDSDTYTVVYRVVDAGGNAIDLSNFDFGASDLEATLKITPKALSVTTGGAEKIYDGTPLVNDEIEVVGLISSEHFAERRNSYTQVVNVTAGADNAITHADLLIIDAAGLDITSNYSLDQRDVTCGSLEITKRNIYITALDLNKTYDGKPLSGQFSADQLELIKNALNADEEYGKNNCVDGEKVYFFAETALGDLNGKEHRIEIINESSVTNATAEDVVNKIGNSEGVLAVITEVTLNPDGSIASEVDVSANYSISAEDGSLSIDKKVISIKARDERRLYNGAPLQSTGIDVMFGEQLAENHSFADFEFEGSQTDVGSVGTSTIVDYDIVDADGNTVLDNYIIENEYTGELRVLAGMVTIQLISKDKIYDGSPLTCEYNVICEEYDTETGESKKTVYKGKLAGEPTDFNNCTLTPQFTGIGETGDIINVEEIYWTIDLDATTLVDAKGQEIDRNNIDIDVAYVDEEGNESSGVTRAYLKIEKRPIQITLSDSDKMYDGIALDRFFQINESDNDGKTLPVADKTIGYNDNASEIEFPLATVPGYKIVVTLSGTRTNVNVNSANGDDATYSIDWNVIDPEGNIVSKDNFDLSGSDLEANFSVSKRPIQITLSDSDKMYDGIALDRFFQINESDNGGNTIPVADKTIGSNDNASKIEFPLATVPGYKIVVTLSGTRTNVNVNSANGDDATYSIDWDVIDPEGNIVSKENFDLSGSDLEANFSVSKRPITINLYADDKIYDGNYVDRYYEIVVSDAVKNSEVSKTKLTSGDETYGVEYAIECMAGFNLSFDIYGTRRNVNITKHLEQDECTAQNFVITRSGEAIDLNNFAIEVESVALEVEQRKVEVVLTTPDSKMYDGKAHDRVVKFIVYGEDGEVIAEQTFSSINGANGTGLSYLIAATNENLNFSFDGTRTNVQRTDSESKSFKIAEGYQISGGLADNDNYEFIGFEATAALHITPRPIKIVLDDSEDYYTGNALNRYYKIAYKDNDEKWVYVKGSADGFLAIAHGENDKDLEAALACSSQTMVYNVNGTKTNVYDGDGSYNITWEVIGADGADIDERNYVLEESDNEATLTVKPRPITITLSAEGKIYDGKYVQRYFEIYISDLVSPTSLGATRIESDKERENIGVDITCMSGFVVSFDVYGRRRNVEYMNHAEQNVCTVQNIVITRDGEKISEESFKGNFDINITSAALNVDKRQVKITLADMTATYNAKPLDRKFTIQELNNEGEWVTITKTVSKYTDEGFANELNYSFDISTVEGESITVVLSGIRTNVDKLTDDDYDTYEVDFKFVNALGEDADLENYDFSENDLEGSFTVEQRKIWISTEDGSKYYDGTPLVNLGSKYQEESQNEGLVEGEKLTVTVNGTETDANEGKVVPGNNTFTYTIFNGELDVHTNYSVEEQPGTLTVYRRRVQIILTNASKMYDGKALDRTYQFKVYATDEKGEFTLADAITIAHGESAENLEFVIPYITGEAETLNFSLEGTRTNVVLTASELDNFGIQKGYTISGGQGLTENYEFIDFDKSAALTVEHRPVKIELQDSKDTYDGFALDRYYRVYVATGYDQEGALIWADIANMGDAQWITVSHSDSDSGIYAMPYDGQSFNFKLVGTKTNVFDGDSQYSMDWNVTDTITGTKIEKSNFLITEGSAKLTVDPRSIWIQTDSNGKIYDGVALVDKDFDYETYYQKMEGNKGLLDGETINVVVNGTITNAGEATNTVSFTVAKGDGKTDSTGNYKLDESKLGKLTVDKRKIEVELTGAEKIYDGKAIDRVYKFIVYGEDDAIVSDDVQYTISDGMSGSYLTYAIGATGETLVFSLNGTRTNVVVTASESAKFGIAEGYLISGGQALNANYEFVGFDATADIKITARPIVIELGNSEAYYNGTYLDRYYKVSDNGELIVDWTTVTKADSETVKAVLSTDHTMTFTLSGRRTNVKLESGDSDKYTTTKWSFTDNEGNAIAATNYAIDGGEATLTVKERELYIEAIEKTVVYTGTYANRYFKVYYLGDDGETMYYASMDAGGNVSWVTDADAYCMLTSDYTSVENLIINCTGEIMSFEIDGSRINVSELGDGYGDKEYSIRTKSLIFAKSDGNDAKKTNYKTTWVEDSANFNITKKKITSLHTEGNTWYYDGKAHTHPKVVAEGLVQGHKIDSTKTKFKEVTNAGTHKNEIVEGTISYVDKNGNPVDMRNYELPEIVCGELVILKLPIEIYSGSGKWFYQEGVEYTNHGYWIHYDAGDNDNRVNNGTLTASADDKSIGTGIITLETGDKLQLVIQGSITEVDSVSNVITYKFISETEDDSEIEEIKDNYDIQLAPGILEVVPSQISIYLDNQEYKYDGKEHKYTGAGIDYSLYAGETFTASNGYTVEYIFENDSLTLPGSIACRIKEFKISKNGEVIYHEIVATNEKSGNMAGNLIVDLEPDYYGILEVYDTFSFSLGRIEKMYTGSQISYSSQSESKYIKALEIADRHDYLRTEVISGTTYYIYDDWTTDDPNDYFAISFNLNLNVPAEHGSIGYDSVNYWIESSGNTYDEYSYSVYRYASDGSRTNVSSYYRIKFEDPESEYLYVVAPRSITLTPVNKVIDANESYTKYLPYTSNDFTISSIEGNKSEFESNYIVEVVTDGRLYYGGEPTVANRIVEYVIYKVTRDADTKEVIDKQEVQRGIFDDYRYVDEGTFFKVTREDGTLIMNYGS